MKEIKDIYDIIDMDEFDEGGYMGMICYDEDEVTNVKFSRIPLINISLNNKNIHLQYNEKSKKLFDITDDFDFTGSYNSFRLSVSLRLYNQLFNRILNQLTKKYFILSNNNKMVFVNKNHRNYKFSIFPSGVYEHNRLINVYYRNTDNSRGYRFYMDINNARRQLESQKDKLDAGTYLKLKSELEEL